MGGAQGLGCRIQTWGVGFKVDGCCVLGLGVPGLP